MGEAEDKKQHLIEKLLVIESDYGYSEKARIRRNVDSIVAHKPFNMVLISTKSAD